MPTLSDGEKLILIMLCEMYEKLGIKGETDTALIKEAIFSGNLWGLKHGMSGLFHDHERQPEVVTETINILDMWTYIESSYANLSDADKEHIKKSTYLGGDVHFHGFDGNNEASYISVADFEIQQLGHFQLFKGRDLNSHSPMSLANYRRMLELFTPMRNESMVQNLTTDQVIQLMEARLHPESPKRKAAAAGSGGESGGNIPGGPNSWMQ